MTHLFHSTPNKKMKGTRHQSVRSEHRVTISAFCYVFNWFITLSFYNQKLLFGCCIFGQEKTLVQLELRSGTLL